MRMFEIPVFFTGDMDRELAQRVLTERIESLDRIWDLVTNSEAADQNTIAVSDIRAALTGGSSL